MREKKKDKKEARYERVEASVLEPQDDDTHDSDEQSVREKKKKKDKKEKEKARKGDRHEKKAAVLPNRDVDDDVADDDDDDEDVSIGASIRGMSIPGSSPDMAGRDITGSEGVRLRPASEEPRRRPPWPTSSESSDADISRKDLPAAEAPRKRMRSRSPARERSRSRRKGHRSGQHRARRE